MDTLHTEKLVYALEKHPEIIPVDKNKLMITLEQTYVPVTSTFHVPVPENRQDLEESDRCFKFSVRRVLINKNAVPYEPSLLKSAYARTVWFSGGYSSDDMTRRIRSDREILDMLRGNPNELSLLAKMETYERKPDGTVYIASRPVLVWQTQQIWIEYLTGKEKTPHIKRKSLFLARLPTKKESHVRNI